MWHEPLAFRYFLASDVVFRRKIRYGQVYATIARIYKEK
jgi:hypothetical protein